MSSPEKSLERILRHRQAPEEVELTDEELAAAMAVVTETQETLARKQYWMKRAKWAGGAVMALAASLLIMVSTQKYQASVPRVANVDSAIWGSDLRNVSRGDSIRAGDELEVAEHGHVEVTFPEGSAVDVEAQSQLKFASVGKKRHFQLQRGTFRAQVVKLKPDEEFIVRTSHAQVQVRGTAFSVSTALPSLECPEGTTRVDVKEGLVEVNSVSGRQHFVKPGESLELGCPPVAPQTVTEAAIEEETEDEAMEVVEIPEKKKKTSSLARMNALYERAMTAKKKQRYAESVRLLGRFRREFPASSLDEAAAVEQLRLYERLQSKKAAAAAREYLEQFPHGYARDVAEEILHEARP